MMTVRTCATIASASGASTASRRDRDHNWNLTAEDGHEPAKTPAELFDDFIKLEWQDIFRKEVDVRLDNGARYVPNGGSQGVQLLRKHVNAFDEAVRLWSGPSDDPDSGTQGYDRIVDQAGIEYTWEWFLIDPSRPWSTAVPPLVRSRIEADLERRDRAALARAMARAADAELAARAKDDNVIADMSSRRVAQGRPPLTAEQEASVRESRTDRRSKVYVSPSDGRPRRGHAAVARGGYFDKPSFRGS